MNRHLKTARFIARVLDTEFSVFGFRFGLDPIIGLIPGIGDIISAAFSTYLLIIALQMHLSRRAIVLMIVNISVDFLFGLVPLLGDIADAWYKANMRNLRIIERYAAK